MPLSSRELNSMCSTLGNITDKCIVDQARFHKLSWAAMIRPTAANLSSLSPLSLPSPLSSLSYLPLAISLSRISTFSMLGNSTSERVVNRVRFHRLSRTVTAQQRRNSPLLCPWLDQATLLRRLT